MALHDSYARATPWEFLFESAGEARDFVSAVGEEAEGRGAQPDTLESFLTMGSVDHLIRRLEGAVDQDGALVRFGGLAFQAYHFTKAGCPLYLLSVHAARYLVEGVPPGRPEPPATSGYVQLPQHLFWASEVGSGEAPASIDGIFWTSAPSGILHTLVVTGVRPDRPGIGVVPLPAAPLADASTWLDTDTRGGSGDFSASLPGAELDGLYQVSTAGELLKLLARFFAYVAGVPSCLEAMDPHTGSDAPRPSSLSYSRVRLSA